MKRIFVLLVIVTVTFSVSFASASKKPIKSNTEKSTFIVPAKSNLYKNSYFQLFKLTFHEDCCDGTDRTSYYVYDENDPLGGMYIPDEDGDCPICPPTPPAE